MAFVLNRKTLGIEDIGTMKRRIERDIRSHRGWYMFQGAVFFIGGILAAILPGVTAISFELLIGTLLLVTGIFQLVSSVRSNMHWWTVLSALLSIAVGGWMLWFPLAGMLALVIALIIFFILEGAFEIFLAFEFRPASNWGWMLVSGIASFVLAALLWRGFPLLSVFYMGLLIAINFIFYGLALMMLAASVGK